MLAENQENSKDRLVKEMDLELAKCGLERREFPTGSRSLFKAVSDWLYFTPQYADELVSLCKNELKRKLDNNSLTTKLSLQFEDRTLVNDYYQNPDLNGFTKVHLGLISLAYDRKVLIYHLHENYLCTISVNNSSNKHLPIVLCRVHNSYAAVFSSEVSKVAEMVKDRICQKLMSHSFSISNNKSSEDRISHLFETPKRLHKKSVSLCDEFQYQGVFGTPLNFPFLNQSHSNKFIPMENAHEDQDLALIGMCNINGYVQYPVQKPISYFGMSPQINRAESMRIISTNSARKDNYELNGGNRQSGRLKFFDESKNYGFIVMDEDNSDIFVHYDDLSKAGMTKEYMRTTKHGQIIRFEFSSMSYIGKYDKSRKAVDLTHVDVADYALF